MDIHASLPTVLEWFEKSAKKAVSLGRMESAALWTDGHYHLTKVADERDALQAQLIIATAALAGGLWDYGPGQDEHEKCNEVIEQCRALLAKIGGAQ